ARSFTVNSDGSISAVSPVHPRGAVDISVTTPTGQSAASASDHFTFAVKCVVPKLKGKKLKKAKKALKKAHCRVGKVRGKHRKHGKVKRQKPKPGTILPAGSKVNIRF
ncbi:MAG: PASTA domain-containing protein, partial [Solirubrobacterales bacterium]|nr:PASTA domain-containing protein [Solirubrobacterales bacterium]